MAACGFCLPFERSELAAQLPLQVREARHIRLGALEPSFRPLLAPAELQDPGGLLDERTTF